MTPNISLNMIPMMLGITPLFYFLTINNRSKQGNNKGNRLSKCFPIQNDFILNLTHNYYYAYDNVRKIPQWLSNDIGAATIGAHYYYHSCYQLSTFSVFARLFQKGICVVVESFYHKGYNPAHLCK